MKFDRTVLQVIPSLDSGGAERTTIEIARAIAQAGGRAIVATSGGRLANEITRVGGEIEVLPVASKNPATIIANRFRLVKLIRDEKIDIVHVRSRAPAWSVLLASRAARVPFVATYHGAYEARSPLKRIYNSAMARADLVIANSNFTAAAIQRLYHVGKRLVVIPRGADLEEFSPEAVSNGRVLAVKSQWGLDADFAGPAILLPGRLTDWKGHDIAIRAAAELAGRAKAGVFPDFKLIFAGDVRGSGKIAAALAQTVDELGLRGIVRMVGHCEDMPAAYLASDIVIAPSVRPEAFGRVPVEAGAMGRLAVATAHGGAAETILDEETGFLVGPGSVEGLARAIARAVELGRGGRDQIGARARSRIAKLYSTRAMTDATILAYAGLLDDWRLRPEPRS